MTSVALLVFVLAAEPMRSADELQRWLTYYYLKPRPELTLSSLAVMDSELAKANKGSLADQVSSGGIRTFYAKVLEANDSVVLEVGRVLGSLPPGQQAFLREALRRCGSAACSQALGAKGSPIEAPAQLDPGCLDDLWAAFFATGDTKYVKEIIGVLPWSEIRGDINKLLTGGAARWSLSSNAYQHRRVLALCEEVAPVSDEVTRRILGEIVAQAKAQRAKQLPPEPK